MTTKALCNLKARAIDGKVVLVAYRLSDDAALDAEYAAITVYRIETAFAYGKDYEEYFHGLRPGPGDAIFRGLIPPRGVRFEVLSTTRCGSARPMRISWPGFPVMPRPPAPRRSPCAIPRCAGPMIKSSRACAP